MIKFRWKDVSTYASGGEAPLSPVYRNGPYDTVIYSVLQCRQEEGPHGEQWWGEWQDMPIVGVDE